MKYRSRTYYTETDNALRSHGSIAGILSRMGGIRPPQRTNRSLQKLSVFEVFDQKLNLLDYLWRSASGQFHYFLIEHMMLSDVW